jgi:hypothetical protein
MSIGSENLLVSAEETIESVREEKADVDTALVELGKVSDTKGGWLGAKMDAGAGLTYA